jgi:two-component system response regulator AtoC
MRFNRILIVDDEEGMRYSLSVILSKNKYKTVAVNDGVAALAVLEEDVDFDFILCDLRMPEMDGLTFLDNFCELDLDIMVIMMSAYGTIDLAVEAMKRGAFDYISKPFKPEEILVVLDKAMKRYELQKRNEELQKEVEGVFHFRNILTQSEKMVEVLQSAEKIADYKTSVLITGESGTGKELVAKAIHYCSSRRNRPFVAINCGAIPEGLLESELFGHLKGAFTDARSNKLGLIPAADRGTLFLDEIGALPTHLQVKLLRVLQEEEVMPVGSTEVLKVDLRVIAATVADLEVLIPAGKFREDLYYRLNIFPVRLPPLRQRTEDIPLLVDHFIEKSSKRLDKKVRGIKSKALPILMDYSWPGNVRELENVIERAVVLCDGDEITPDDIGDHIRQFRTTSGISSEINDLSIKRNAKVLEDRMIRAALKRTGGNRTRAAKLLEISHRALLYKIQEYKIKD